MACRMSHWMISPELFNDNQRKLINSSIDQKVLVVTGPPGSGKTLVAVYYLRKLYRKEGNRSARLIVFTHVLRRFIQSGLEELELPPDMTVLSTQFMRLSNRTFDYLIIDEFQDFHLENGSDVIGGTIQQYLGCINKGMLMTGDGRQRIYPNIPSWRRTDLAAAISQYGSIRSRGFQMLVRELQEHYRLPKAITDVAASLLPQEEAEKLCSYWNNEDAEAQTWKLRSFNTLAKAKYIRDIVVNRGFTSVGILVWYSNQGNSIIAAFKELGIDVHSCLTNEGKSTVDFNDHVIKVMTVHSAKGVQFDCVFLPFGETVPPRRSHAYVAVTRPVKMLGILYSGNLASPFKEIPSTILPELIG